MRRQHTRLRVSSVAKVARTNNVLRRGACGLGDRAWARLAAVIFHVDMDAFFAAVEVRDDPSLRGKPVLVGGGGKRGVIATASYEARKFGCQSAMPTAVALRRCPDAVVVPPRGEAYAEASAQVFEVLRRYSPLVEPLSIDEAFLDMEGTARLLGPPVAAATKLRADVRAATGLTCSVGISRVKFIAKLASGMHKPDGLTLVDEGRELAFLHPLPVEQLWGVGKKTAVALQSRGIRTVGDLAERSVETLRGWFGASGEHLHALSRGIDPRGVEPDRERKSVGHEDTFEVDVRGREVIPRKLLSLATRVADRLVAQGLRGRRVQLKIRDDTFKTETRQCMLPQPTSSAKEIYRAACVLLGAVELEGRAFRLTGVSVGGFAEDERAPAQGELALESGGGEVATKDALQGVLSAVRDRFGHAALFPADAGVHARAGAVEGGVSKQRRG